MSIELTDEQINEAFDSFCRNMSLVSVLYREDAQKFARTLLARSRARITADTGDSEADSLIDRLMSLSPTFTECERAAGYIRRAALAASPDALTDERVFELVGEVLGQPLIAEDLRQGFAVHTEPRDWLNFARALLAASPAALTEAQTRIAELERAVQFWKERAEYRQLNRKLAASPADPRMEALAVAEKQVEDAAARRKEREAKWGIAGASPVDKVEDARDAARYRWLRSDDIEVLPGQREILVIKHALPFTDEANEVLTESDLDAAIDAAMSASKEGEQNG